MRRAAGIVLAALAMVTVLAAPAAAAEAGAVEEVSVLVHHRKHPHRNVLFLAVYPQKGLATVSTVSNELELENRRGVAYAVAILAQPFERSLDVTVPGLGEFVGTVTPEREHPRAARCSSGSAPVESATFEGRIEFRGAGGYGSWSATHAEAGVTRSCRVTAAKQARPDAIFDAIAGVGTMLPGPSSFRFFSQARDRSREFVAVDGASPGLSMIAVDREWLPGEVATQRWVSRWGVRYPHAMTIGPGEPPAVVTFHPPSPFFGTAVFRRSTHSLAGSLGVNFLGLRMKLTRPPLPAVLEDEEVGVE